MGVASLSPVAVVVGVALAAAVGVAAAVFPSALDCSHTYNAHMIIITAKGHTHSTTQSGAVWMLSLIHI